VYFKETKGTITGAIIRVYCKFRDMHVDEKGGREGAQIQV